MNAFFRYLIPVFCLLTQGIDAAEQVANEPLTTSHALLEQLHSADQSQIFVVAHRGIWRDFPENSLPAIRRAVKMGVHMVELDIRLTRDQQLVVIHDKTLDRTTTGAGLVSHHTLEEIKSLRLLNGYGVPTEETVPTLREALLEAKDHALVYLDKSYELIPQAFALAQEIGVQDQVFFYGHVTADQLQLDYPKLHKTLNYLPKLSPEVKNRRAYIQGFLDRERSPAFVVNFDHEDPSFFDDLTWIRASKKRIWASPLWPGMSGNRTDDRAMKDPDANWGWLLDQGFSMICTDRPRELIAYLANRKSAALHQPDHLQK